MIGQTEFIITPQCTKPTPHACNRDINICTKPTSAVILFTAKSRCVDYFINGEKKTCSSCIVELYQHFGIFKNTREVREAMNKTAQQNSFFFSVRERAEFNKSCNLIGSGSGWNFPIRPALGGRNLKKCFKFVWTPFK